MKEIKLLYTLTTSIENNLTIITLHTAIPKKSVIGLSVMIDTGPFAFFSLFFLSFLFVISFCNFRLYIGIYVEYIYIHRGCRKEKILHFIPMIISLPIHT